MAGKPRRDPNRPKQGAHLLALRQAAGLTQTQLAEFLEVPQGTIALWERSEKPPRSELLPQLATALRVSVSELLLATATKPRPLAKNAGPISQTQKMFEKVRALPRRQQQKIVDVVSAMLNEFDRKTG